MYIEMKRYESAIGDFNKAIHLDPNEYYFVVSRGYAHFHAKHYEEAIADLSTGMNGGPLRKSKRSPVADSCIGDYDYR